MTAPQPPEMEPVDCNRCGKKARVFKDGTNYDGRPLFYVACKRSRCGIRTKNELNPKKAIAVWNSVAPSTGAESVVIGPSLQKFIDYGNKYKPEYKVTSISLHYSNGGCWSFDAEVFDVLCAATQRAGRGG